MLKNFARNFVALALALSASGAFAAVGINKSFVPNSVSASQPSAMTVVLLNPNTAAATGVAVTDSLPSGVVIATPVTIGTNTCSFDTSAITAGGTAVTVSAGTIPALSAGVAGQCTFSVNVVSNTPDTYLNTIPANAVTSSQGSNAQAAQATLVVSSATNVTGGKAFSPANVHGNGTPSTLTITLTNPNSIPLTGAAITDTLPTAITIATPSNTATTCGPGTATASAPATSPSTIALAAGVIPANASCTITVNVIARNPNALVNGNQLNTIAAGALVTDQGASNPAFTANINVQTGASQAKAFSPTLITPNGTSNLTITFTNYDATALAPIAFTDNLPGTISATALPVSTCGGTVTPLPATGPPYTSFSLSGGSLAGVTSAAAGTTTCTVTVPVTATASGTNTLPAANFGGVVIASGNATLSVTNIAGSKAFTTPAVQNGSTTLTVTLTNTTATAATITGFTDNLTTMGTGFTVGGPAIVGANDCGATVVGAVGATTFTASGGTIPANGSCTITVPVAIGPTATTGNRTDTIAAGAVKVLIGTTAGSNAVALTGTVNVQRALTATKAFSPASIAKGGVTRLTVTLAPLVNLTGAAFTDDLTTMGSGFAIAAVPNATVTNCGGGTVTATAGATSFTFAGGTLTASTNCLVSVNVQTPATAGTFTNTIPAANFSTTQGVTEAAVTGAVNLLNGSVTINKSFSPTTVALGTIAANDTRFSTLSVQIRNNNPGAIALTGVGLTDSLPTGMVIANPATTSLTGTGCALGTITAAVGATQFSLASATIAANAVCTLSVRVIGTLAGNLINNIQAGALSSTQGFTNTLQGTATLAVTGSANLTITKTDGVASVVPGTTTTYTVAVTNSGPNDVTGLGITDPQPSGMTFTSWSCTASAGSACPVPASGAGDIAGNVTVLNGGNVTFTVNAKVASGATGTSITNTASLLVPGSVIDTNPVNTASDTDTLSRQADLSITKTDGVTSAVPGAGVVYTIVASNSGPSDAIAASVTDTASSSFSTFNWTCVASAGSSCPASGSGSIAATVNILSGGNVTFTVNAAIATTAVGTLTNTATVTAPSNVTDTNPANNSATDTDTLTPVVNLGITKTDGVTHVAAGGSTVYTIVVSNTGPSAALGATLTDTAPAGMTFGSWTCVATAGSSCTASGTGNLSTLVNVLPGGKATFTVNATISNTATGTLVNTATIGVPPGATDSDPSNNSASDSDTVDLTADLSITKTDGVTSIVAGANTTYTIVVTNHGPSAVTGASVVDTLPADLDNATYTATGSAGASGFTPSGSGDINDTVNLQSGATITYTLTATVSPDATGSVANTAKVTAPSGVTDPTPGNNTATDTDTVTKQVTLAVVKTDGSASYTPGGTAVYTITVTDTGLSDAANVTVADALPAGLTLTGAANCVATGIADCGTVTGVAGGTSFGATAASVGAGIGNSLVFTVPVAFAPDMTVNPLVNTATATDVGTGATASGQDSDTRSAQVTLAVTKTDGSTTYTPGGTATYTVTVTHGGISDADNVTVTDNLPIGLTLTRNATCAATGTASCGTVTGATGGTSFGTTGATIAAGAGNQLAFTLPVAFDAGMTTDPLVNSATATDLSSGATGTGTDSDTRSANVSLALTKTDNSPTYTPGGSATYVITVGNTGLTDALDVGVDDTLQTGVTLTGTVTCVATGDASCGTVTGSTGQSSFNAATATIAAGAGNLLTFTVPVAFASNLTGTTVVNSVTATDVPSGASGSATDTDTRAASAGLAVTKTDNSTTYTPGGSATYTIVASNSGPSDAMNTTVTDNLPAGVTLSGAATCVAAGTAVCGTLTGATGDTSFGATAAAIPAGAANTLTFTVPVLFASTLTANPLVNSVTVSDPASATNATASDSDTLAASADLAISKTDGLTSVTPGGSTTYTIVVTNNGPSNVTGASVADALPAAVNSASFTATATGGASGFTASGSGSIADTVNMPVGSTITYTLIANIAASATGSLTNTATVSTPSGVTDPTPGNNSATDIDGLGAVADLSITKTDGSALYTPGGTITYTIVASNGGPSAVTGATVTDTLPAAITGATWTCVGASGGACPASGSGNISSLVDLPVGASVTFTLTGTVSLAATGSLSNTATVATPPGVTDPVPGNNSATDVDTLTPTPVLALTKTDGVDQYAPGGSGTYVITVTNTGLGNATNTTVSDALPAGVTLVSTPTCVATGAASCGTVSGTAGGSTFTAAGAAIAAGSGNSLVYQVPVNFAASLTAAQITNTATASDPAAPTTASGSDTDTRGSTSGGGGTSPSVPVPVDARWALLLMAGLLAAHAGLRLRRKRPG